MIQAESILATIRNPTDADSAFLPIQSKAEQAQDEILQKLLQRQTEITLRAQKEITFASPLMTIDSLPFLYPNTIAVISAKTGLHKSRLAEIIASVLLADNEYGNADRPLNFNANKNCAVALIDTERNLAEQLPYAIQCISRLAHGDPFIIPKDFYYTSILPEPRASRFEYLQKFVTYCKEQTEKHLVVIIDVLTDICTDFNDPKSSQPVIDLINNTINQESCTFLVVIHQNPSGLDGKARGHLGTEIENKASTVVSLSVKDKQDDIITIECRKQRSVKRFPPMYVRYDESRKTLVRLGEQETEQFRATETPNVDWEKIFGKETELSSKELVSRMQEVGMSERTAKRRIEESKYAEELKRQDGHLGKYYLPSRTPETEKMPFESEESA